MLPGSSSVVVAHHCILLVPVQCACPSSCQSTVLGHIASSNMLVLGGSSLRLVLWNLAHSSFSIPFPTTARPAFFSVKRVATRPYIHSHFSLVLGISSTVDMIAPSRVCHFHRLAYLFVSVHSHWALSLGVKVLRRHCLGRMGLLVPSLPLLLLLILEVRIALPDCSVLAGVHAVCFICCVPASV